MATIGLDKLFYAPITEAANGDETYGTPVQLAKAISADLSVELAEATLYADDGASEVVKEFKSGTLSLGVDDIGASVAAALTGITIDRNKVWLAQTPQAARIDLLKSLYARIEKEPLNFTPTDEASILEFFGEPVYIVKGESANDKLTTPEDFEFFASRANQF